MAHLKSRELVVAATLLMCAAPASAGHSSIPLPVFFMVAQQTYVDVVNMLENSGYRVLDMKSTFLGRIRIRAVNLEHVRQVVVSRSTGEIKSDQIIQVLRASSDGQSQIQRNSIAGGTSGNQTSSSGSGGGLGVSVGNSSGSVGSQGASVSHGGSSVSVGSDGIGLGN